jgi:hypothetical protein
VRVIRIGSRYDKAAVRTIPSETTRRGLIAAALASCVAACSVIAGLGPQPGPLPAVGDAATGDAPPGPPPDGAPSGDAPGGPAAMVGNCRIFPPDNPWNRDVSNDPVDTNAMSTIFPNMDLTAPLHADWGDTINNYGMPFNVSQAAPIPITFTGNVAQSDPAACPGDASPFCYPIPPGAKVEAASNGQHVLVLDTTGAPNDCTLYEIIGAVPADAGTSWTATNGAFFHLGSDALRPDGFISTDQAGLPILPGLVKFGETSLGEIDHAIRLTMRNTQLGYIHPATHAVGMATPTLPPMGLRLRLKASFDTSSMSGLALVIVKALKKYGVILADTGSDWYITGERNDGWTVVLDDIVTQLRNVHGSDFEIVQSGSVMTTGL